jgi:hypothetical protein
MVQSVQSGVWTGPGLPHAVQSACLTWPDQSSVHLGLDGLQATQAPELHSKILCNIFIYKASATRHHLHFAYAPPPTIIPYFALLPGDFPMPLGYFPAAPGQTRLVLSARPSQLSPTPRANLDIVEGFRWQLGWDGAVKAVFLMVQSVQSGVRTGPGLQHVFCPIRVSGRATDRLADPRMGQNLA